jgi:predicted DNA-binding helix-hairpin-helix protein
MAHLRERIDAAKDESRALKHTHRFAPAGQSTQMIVGADDSTDQTIIEKSVTLYSSYRLRRVYYSAFSPILDASRFLPARPAPLMREHRLYQTDWLLRFYGFQHAEVFEHTDGMLDLEMDPKLAWALKHREQFPIDLNKAPREQLLRVPGLGRKAVQRIIAARRLRTIHIDDLRKLHVPVKRVLPFVKLVGHEHSRALDSEKLKAMLTGEPQQLSLLAS